MIDCKRIQHSTYTYVAESLWGKPHNQARWCPLKLMIDCFGGEILRALPSVSKDEMALFLSNPSMSTYNLHLLVPTPGSYCISYCLPLMLVQSLALDSLWTCSDLWQLKKKTDLGLDNVIFLFTCNWIFQEESLITAIHFLNS